MTEGPTFHPRHECASASNGATDARPPISPRPGRRAYIDWFRGLAILIMIEAHVLDSWTLPGERSSVVFGWAMVVGGFAAPAFLFLAGLGTVLAVSGKRRRLGSEGAAAAAVQRRGWEIFGLAFLFRAQSWALNPGAPLAGLLKVDILNIMGPAMALSGAVLGAARTLGRRLAIFAGITAAFTLLAPIVRTTPWLAWLPDPLEWYLRPQPGRATFTMFPWAGFLVAGSFVGILLDRERSERDDRGFHVLLLVAGVLVAAVGYGASFLPPLYRGASFWTTSPTFFFLRVGILVALLGALRLWEARPTLTAIGPFAPLARFGRSSMFVYWIHVEMVYGWMSAPLHKALSIGEVAVAFSLFSGGLFALVLVKDRWAPKGTVARAIARCRARLGRYNPQP